MSDDEFLTELRQELLRAAGDQSQHSVRRRRRRARTALLGIAATITLVAVSLSLVALQSDEAQAALRVTRSEDGLLIELADLTATPDAVEEAARTEGIELSVTAVPVGPSNVGKFVALNSDQPLTFIERTGVDPTSNTFTGIQVPDGFDGTLDFEMGRAARPDEQWFANSDALAPGERLECQDLIGIAASEAARVTADQNLTRQWFAVSATEGTAELADNELGDYAEWKVSRVLGTGEDKVLFEITETGETPAFVPPVGPTC